jgi:acetyl esterase/lipase
MTMVMALVAGLFVAAAPTPVSAAQFIGVRYGPGPGNSNLMDINIPDAGEGPFPVLIWTNGSAWSSDNDRNGAPVSQFTAAGYAVVGVSIHSRDQAKFPAQQCDIKGAVRFLRQNAETYNLDPNNFAWMGFSSGGWTAAFAGAQGGSPDPDDPACSWLEEFGLGQRISDRIQAAIPMSAPTDFLQMDDACEPYSSPVTAAALNWATNPGDYPVCGSIINHDAASSPESGLMGCAIVTCPERVRLANPLAYVNDETPPFLLLHNREDPLVPNNQSAILKNALIGACRDVTFYSIEGGNHDTFYLSTAARAAIVFKSRGSCAQEIASTATEPMPTYATVIAFLDRVLTAEPEPEPFTGGTATGGGWLASNEGAKINFGFQAETTDSRIEGDLSLNDHGQQVKVQITSLDSIGAVTEPCGPVSEADNSLQFTGSGTHNGQPASFRVCVTDNGPPGQSDLDDLLFLECTSGCTYSTDNRSNGQVAGGNVQVDRGDEVTSEGTAQSSSAGEQTANSSEAQTIILDPVLLTRLAPGAQQPLSVRVYDGDQQPVSSVPVTLHTNSSGGATGITALTNSAGVAILVVTGLTQSAEYVATSGSAVSNTIRIAAPILP